MRILLHACCGPCSIVPGRVLSGRDEVTFAFVNPNIHPVEEYEMRRSVLLDYAAEQCWPVVEMPYDPEPWHAHVGIHGSDRASRCRACYRLRFEAVARMARESGFDAISTTLSVSPYQEVAAIEEELIAAARAAGVSAVFEDFRDGYPEATSISRERGMYRQNYCGCAFSQVEAEEGRERRRAERKAKKEGGR